MKCPKCGKINPDTVAKCECGHSFESGKAEELPTCVLPPKSRSRCYVSIGGIWTQ